ncbi:MAG: TonB-dependent receptor [Sphingomicrobium sp.]
MLTGPIIVALAAAAPSAPGDANRRSPPDAIIVTGERIRRTLRETASSVTVIDARDIATAPAPDRVEQMLAMVPNVQLGSGGEGPTIRGLDSTGPTRDLPAFVGGTRPRTTMIVDGRPLSFNEFIFGVQPLWDIARIEVFRSPQTTNRGQNSIAGAIIVQTRDPSFTAGYAARAIAGDRRGRQLSLSATGPLAGSQLAYRVAGDYRFSHPASKIADQVRGADPDRDEYGLIRAKLHAHPDALPGSDFGLTLVHSRSQMPQIEGVQAPFRARRDPNPGYGTFRTNVGTATATARFSTSDALAVDALLSSGDAHVRRFAPPGLGITNIRSRDVLGEVILTLRPSPRLSGLFGASLMRTQLRQRIDLSAFVGIGRFADVQTGLGLFGEWTAQLGSKAKATAGLRYQRDRQRRAGGVVGPGADIRLDYARAFDAWLPKFSIEYALSPQISVGGLVQKAYNPGGTTLRFDTGRPDPFGAERLWDYELFARATAFGGRVSAALNLFTYDIRDAQRARTIIVLTPSGAPVTFADLSNVPRARASGLEANFDARLSATLRARFALGLLRTRITRTLPENALFAGKDFQRSPGFSASAALDWQPARAVELSAQLRHNAGYFSDDANDRARRITGSTTIDARAGWTHRGLSLFAYGRNLTDEFHLTYLFTPSFGTAGDPRELGVGVELRF